MSPSSQDVPIPEDVSDSIFEQAMQIWVRPELERRTARGLSLSEGQLDRFQILMWGPQENNKVVVRLNDEVITKAFVKLRDGQTTTEGDQVRWEDLEEIVELLPADSIAEDAAHITGILDPSRRTWIVSFSFLYNRTRRRKHLEKGHEFLKTAQDSATAGRLNAAAENCYAATELFARALRLELPFEESKKHAAYRKWLNDESRIGNLDKKFYDAYVRLEKLRKTARYAESGEQPTPRVVSELLSLAYEMASRVEAVLEPSLGNRYRQILVGTG